MSRIFGIDLGTTNSLIAVMEGERPQITPDPETASPLLPSVVAITPQGEVIVGERAIAMEPHLTVERNGRIHAIGFEGGEAGAVVPSNEQSLGLGGGGGCGEARPPVQFASITRPGRACSSGQRTLTPAHIAPESFLALSTP